MEIKQKISTQILFSFFSLIDIKIMNEELTEHKKQLEKEIKETNKQIRMMIKVCLYTSFVLLLSLTIFTIYRGFMEGFF